MPLKKPKELPKIPKTRKKKSGNALTAIPEKKPDKLEYVCKVFFGYDEATKTRLQKVCIETLVEFRSFAYEVSLEHWREKNEVFIVIMGLKSKTNIVPDILPARTDVEFEDLIGDVTINVIKQDGAINSAIFNINPFTKKISLQKVFKSKKKNNRLFCSFEVAMERSVFP
ncbi:MAG: hypothetical protein V1720_10140 [bacterium]